MINRCIYFLLILGLFFTCRKDEVQVNDPILNIEEPIVLDGYEPQVELVTASVYGQIIDENGAGMDNVQINIEDNQTLTDNLGFFYLYDIQMNKLGAQIKAKKSGYVNGSRLFYPKDDSAIQVKIKMIPKVVGDAFNSRIGGTIEIDGGVEIEFEPEGIAFANGDPYEGNVNVVAKYLDPTNVETLDEMPGSLMGIRPSLLYEQTALKSYGMVLVKLYSDSDQKLQLLENAPATLKMPIPATMLGNAPTSIPLWYYNESAGRWVEDGVAMKQGDFYVGQVRHFSFWNCDIPVEYTTIELTFKDDSGNPVAGMDVWIKSEESGIGRGITDENGVVAGIVPANEELTVCASALLDNQAFAKDIGSISTPSSFEIEVDTRAEGFIVLLGNLFCDGTPISDGLAIVKNGDDTRIYPIVGHGFVILVLKDSDDEAQYTLQLVSPENDATSQTIVFNETGTFGVGNYEMCNVQMDEYIIYTHNQTDFIVNNPRMWKADFVSPPVTYIEGEDADGFRASMSFHGDAVGDYATEIGNGIQTFIKNNINIGTVSTTYFSEAATVVNITSYDVNGYVEGDFSGELFINDSANNQGTVPVFGRFRVKYDEGNLDGSYIESFYRNRRIVEPGITGRESSLANSFDTQNSATSSFLILFKGLSVGDYSKAVNPNDVFINNMIGTFRDLDFVITAQPIENFIVTDFNPPGGFVKGNFSGMEPNLGFGLDSDPELIEGNFVILHKE